MAELRETEPTGNPTDPLTNKLKTQSYVINGGIHEARTEAMLQTIFREDLQVEVPLPETDLFRTGILDSIKVVEMLLCLETRFGLHVEFDDLEIENFRSINAVNEFVKTCISEQHAPEPAGTTSVKLPSTSL
jgi:acyl carrier protein